MLTRRALLALLSVPKKRVEAQQPPDRCPINVVIDKGPSVRVTAPNIAKDQIIGLVATFFSRDKPAALKQMTDALNRAKDVSITLTSKCQQ